MRLSVNKAEQKFKTIKIQQPKRENIWKSESPKVRTILELLHQNLSIQDITNMKYDTQMTPLWHLLARNRWPYFIFYSISKSNNKASSNILHFDFHLDLNSKQYRARIPKN